MVGDEKATGSVDPTFLPTLFLLIRDSWTPIFVDADFAKVQKTSMQFLAIRFPLMIFGGKMLLA